MHTDSQEKNMQIRKLALLPQTLVGEKTKRLKAVPAADTTALRNLLK